MIRSRFPPCVKWNFRIRCISCVWCCTMSLCPPVSGATPVLVMGVRGAEVRVFQYLPEDRAVLVLTLPVEGADVEAPWKWMSLFILPVAESSVEVPPDQGDGAAR